MVSSDQCFSPWKAGFVRSSRSKAGSWISGSVLACSPQRCGEHYPRHPHLKSERRNLSRSRSRGERGAPSVCDSNWAMKFSSITVRTTSCVSRSVRSSGSEVQPCWLVDKVKVFLQNRDEGSTLALPQCSSVLASGADFVHTLRTALRSISMPFR